MADLTAGFETGTNTNAIATTDTGDATAWDGILAIGGGSNVYDNTHVFDGTLAAKSVSGSGQTGLAWHTGSLTEQYGRIYLWVDSATITSSQTVIFAGVWGGGRNGRIDLAFISAGHIKLRLIDAPASGQQTGSVDVALDQWVRVEWHMVHSATVGQIEAKLFNDPASTSPSETVSSPATWNTGTATTLYVFGAKAEGGTSGFAVWMDAIVGGATTWPGPLPTTGQVLLASADSVDGAWTDQAGGTSLAAAIDETTASDTDFIRSEEHPSTSGCRVKLASGTDPASSTGHIIHWRIRKESATGETINGTVKLYQGGGDSLGAGTLIASFNRSNVDGSGWTTYDEALSGAEADAISDYSDLYLEFFAGI